MFAFITTVATLLLMPMNSHARLTSTARLEDGGDNKIVISTIHDFQKELLDNNLEKKYRKQTDDDTIIVEYVSQGRGDMNNNPFANTFFNEDYWYSFQPLESASSQQWKVQRTLKTTTKMGRKLQLDSVAEPSDAVESAPPRVSVSAPIDNIGGEVNPSNNNINNDAVENLDKQDDAEGSNNDEEYIKTITNIVLSLSCVCMAAIAAGLTLGMLSLDVSMP